MTWQFQDVSFVACGCPARPFTTYDIIQLVNALAATMTTITPSSINILSVSKAR